MSYVKPTFQHAKKILEIVSKGLSDGLGDPIPGQMCVEAAVCFAMGEPHNDNPKCVASPVSSFKITLNDADGWSSDRARGQGLKRVAIAQLGTRGKVKGNSFFKALIEVVVREHFPRALRKAAAVQDSKLVKRELLAIIPLCQSNPQEAWKTAMKILVDYSWSDEDNHPTEHFLGDFLDNSTAGMDPEYMLAFFGELYPDRTAPNYYYRKVADVCEAALRLINAPGVEFLDKLLPR